MGFWMTTLSGIISGVFGAFIGVLGALGIAYWQLKKQSMTNEFYTNHLKMQFYLDEFEEEAERILDIITQDRKNARTRLNLISFDSLKEYAELAIKSMNPNLEDDHVILHSFNRDYGSWIESVPPRYYKESAKLCFYMAYIYSFLVYECRNLIDGLPAPVFPGRKNMSDFYYLLKKFRKLRKKMQKDIDI
ncbi:UNVERIFIED_ORG: hypothetical protein QFZ59_002507 [Bacillus sp. B2I3]|nr:hypothetical protein [Bacillus sp. B2I3]